MKVNIKWEIIMMIAVVSAFLNLWFILSLIKVLCVIIATIVVIAVVVGLLVAPPTQLPFPKFTRNSLIGLAITVVCCWVLWLYGQYMIVACNALMVVSTWGVSLIRRLTTH
jgi:hypothetical protein